MASRKAVPVELAQAPASPVVNPEPILTPQDVADRLRFDSTRTVYELTRRRNKRPLPAMKAGRVLRFYWSEVERWLRGEDVA
jgi:helix-turn-helix protein